VSRRPGLALLAMALIAAAAPARAQDAPPPELVVFAAGSLRAVLTEFGREFEAAQTGPARVRLRSVFGASGLLKDRIVGGERADVFASANMEHPQAVAQGATVQRFARNQLCVLAHPEAGVTAANVVDRMLDPALKLGTSTPRADPSGDYAWAMFRRIDARGGRYAGSQAALERKALQLTGGPNSPPPPAGRNVYGVLVAGRDADLFVTYCTNAVQARAEQPGLQQVELPEDINVAADYGVLVLPAAAGAAGESQAAARRYVDALLAPAGQALLARHGFAPR